MLFHFYLVDDSLSLYMGPVPRIYLSTATGAAATEARFQIDKSKL